MRPGGGEVMDSWDGKNHTAITRRWLLGTGAALGGGMMAALVAACGGGGNSGGSDSGAGSTAATTAPGQAAKQPKSGGTARVNMGAQNVFLDPHQTALPNVSWLWGNISHHLVEIAPDRSVTNEGLAASWEVPDPLTFVFKLHDGI